MNILKRLSVAQIFVLIFNISVVGCSNKSDSGTIKGTISNAKEGYVYLDEITANNFITQDSSKLGSSGNFELTFNTKETGFFRIRLSESNYILLILNEKEQVEFTGDANNLGGTAKVKGSEETSKLFEATHVLQSNAERLDSINTVYQNAQGSENIDEITANLQAAYMEIINNETVFVKDFIDKNINSLACLAVIDKLSSDEHLEYYNKLDKALIKKYPNLPYTKLFHDKVAELNKLGIGSEAPEITLNTPEGKSISLNSLRGKVVLIDFWASWCRPCRMENPNVVRIYNAYKDKGFDIYSVSLDKEKGAWEEAIKADGLVWPSHVSDLGYWQSSVVKQYNLTGIPFTCLIDKNGKIIAKGLRGDALEAKIKEALGL
ncbi:MAG: AhpC/TSA family protein [Bacteroidia bacterium]|nr:AhpC/TSA family protein [Bacteroidia bacterium]MCZ2249416.1 AhpC/TSA family protein [Bacteroidia bacterium]